MKLCDYGCGQEAKYQFKNGKWCCSISTNECEEVRKRSSFKRKDAKRSEEQKEKIRKGCIGRKLTDEHKQKISLKCEGKNHTDLTKKKISESNTGKICKEETKEKIRKALIGKPSKNKDKHGIYSEETIVKFKISHIGKKHSEGTLSKLKGRIPWNKNKKLPIEFGEKISKALTGKKGLSHVIEINRQRLLNGDALKMIKAIKKISKPELKLREMVKQLFLGCEFQYKILNYAVDVAIPDYKIAIEYDGYYHFDTEEHKEYHKMRQKRIEEQNWKFLRYTIFDKFPNIEKLEKDIFKNK